MRDAKEIIVGKASEATVPLHVVSAADWPVLAKTLDKPVVNWAAAQAYMASPLSLLMVPGQDGALRCVYVGAPKSGDDVFGLGAISGKLPAGTYAFSPSLPQAELVALGWCLELYKYDPYRSPEVKHVKLVCPSDVNRKRLLSLANTSFEVRDRINSPANLFGPDDLEKAARELAKTHKAKLRVVAGKTLEKDFPLIHTVGAAASQVPRLIDFTWGPARAPKVTLVGKGVCFDTGGLDIKPSAGMLLMKKDMGGAANVLGLARLIMEAKLTLRLRVLIPAVENSQIRAAHAAGAHADEQSTGLHHGLGHIFQRHFAGAAEHGRSHSRAGSAHRYGLPQAHHPGTTSYKVSLPGTGRDGTAGAPPDD